MPDGIKNLKPPVTNPKRIKLKSATIGLPISRKCLIERYMWLKIDFLVAAEDKNLISANMNNGNII